MAYKVDVFGNTGFDSVNIPCAPDLLYTDEFSSCLLRQYEDMFILQDEVGQFIQVEEENAEEILSCDYVIVYDEDYGPSEDWLKKATCFIVKSAQMVAPNTCKVYLMKDPYNTMGGFDHRYNHNNIVIAGSVQRISVPMIKYTDKNGHTEDDDGYEHYKAIWPQRENDDFFTLEEPFQPSQKCIMNYQPFTPTPPSPPGPVTDGLWGPMSLSGWHGNYEAAGKDKEYVTLQWFPGSYSDKSLCVSYQIHVGSYDAPDWPTIKLIWFYRRSEAKLEKGKNHNHKVIALSSDSETYIKMKNDPDIEILFENGIVGDAPNAAKGLVLGGSHNRHILSIDHRPSDVPEEAWDKTFLSISYTRRNNVGEENPFNPQFINTRPQIMNAMKQCVINYIVKNMSRTNPTYEVSALSENEQQYLAGKLLNMVDWFNNKITEFWALDVDSIYFSLQIDFIKNDFSTIYASYHAGSTEEIIEF